ncbi:MAG: ParB family transcriptional regulator, chromosome partitioning protein [Blastocatellia bacterium]|nr:ParB family transcriptional regulator, chromosome partitioning protein [Blastocatellia bacterium]MDX6558295.1 ParB family transcriptional regulator, chromosome partitioning protein [Blastocatellia bacterium]
MSSRRGLPTGLSMRHDAHYVEELTQSNTTVHVGRLVPIDKIDPNPDQPRTDIGDLTELTASISEKGVLEPLLVKPTMGRWMIIAGERRWRAATAAGLTEVPCIEMDVDESAVAEIALIENMQRKDLTPWEEADGLRALCERFGYTHEDVARKVGKSRSTVTEALSIASIPKEIREICRSSEITSKSLLLQIVRQPDDESMRTMAEQIASEGLTRDGARKARRAFVDPTGASEPYVYRFEAPGREFKVEVKFKKANISAEELFDALNAAAQNIDEAS